MELYEIVCQLNKHGLSLPPVPGGMMKVPGERNREVLRLRIIEGLTLAEIGLMVDVSSERVRQLLRFHFGLTGKPPAVKARLRSR
ncbi:MAG: sigma factor-like helix-turn-helix DNA-binding protein [Solirubrobacteraceae bacterium]